MWNILSSIVFLCITVKGDVSEPVRDLINKYIPIPSSTGAKSHLFNLTQEPHLAGTQGNLNTAQYVLDKFLQYGIPNVAFQTFDTLINYPVERAVQLFGPAPFNCTLEEAVVPQDPTSNNTNSVMTFHGYAASGDVTAEVIYANYGRREDYEYLDANNISIVGKIVITRYAKNFRGVKVREAQIRGALGVLIYSDPQDDGYGKGKVYPDGVFRPETGVQRGSVQYSMVCPGDPRRVEVCLDDAAANYTGSLIPSIPSIPLSWGDAEPILRSLGGIAIPNATWQGGLNFTYTIGPGPQLRLYVNNSLEVRNLTNVIAIIPGNESANEFVVLGNHRDAWVFGAFDPSSGTTALLEMARGLGQLYLDGWKPKRTIILGSWDGEEYGLIGSTHWVENNEEILKKTVAYVNVDVGVKGKTFSVDGTPSLNAFLKELTTYIRDPDSQLPLSSVWTGQIDPLGAGSDYSAFIHHEGVPSLHLAFTGSEGVYHSNYDSYSWMNLVDPNFVYHTAMAQLWGSLAIALSDSNVAPLKYTDTANALQQYLNTIKQSLSGQSPSPVNLTELEMAINTFSKNSYVIQAQVLDALNSDLSIEDVQSLNKVLYDTERLFLVSEGLPGQFYFKHPIQSVGLSTGYAAITFPGLTEAIRSQNWTLAQQQAKVLSDRISAASDNLASEQEASDTTTKYNAAVVALAVVCGILFIVVILLLLRLFRPNRRTQPMKLDK